MISTLFFFSFNESEKFELFFFFFANQDANYADEFLARTLFQRHK